MHVSIWGFYFPKLEGLTKENKIFLFFFFFGGYCLDQVCFKAQGNNSHCFVPEEAESPPGHTCRHQRMQQMQFLLLPSSHDQLCRGLKSQSRAEQDQASSTSSALGVYRASHWDFASCPPPKQGSAVRHWDPRGYERCTCSVGGCVVHPVGILGSSSAVLAQPVTSLLACRHQDDL